VKVNVTVGRGSLELRLADFLGIALGIADQPSAEAQIVAVDDADVRRFA
jgi:hypothetical protein